jgi:DNA-binding HxlR family transcriptional regulator
MIFPNEIKESVSVLDSDLRWRIIELIYEGDLSYTELLRKLEIRKGSLTHHLNKLIENGILDNYSMKEFGDPYNSYYRLSSFARDLIDGLLSSIKVVTFDELKSTPVELVKTDINFDMRYSDFFNSILNFKEASINKLPIFKFPIQTIKRQEYTSFVIKKMQAKSIG